MCFSKLGVGWGVDTEDLSGVCGWGVAVKRRFGESRAGWTQRTRPLATRLDSVSVQVRGGGKSVEVGERGDGVWGGSGMGVGCLSAEEVGWLGCRNGGEEDGREVG